MNTQALKDLADKVEAGSVRTDGKKAKWQDCDFERKGYGYRVNSNIANAYNGSLDGAKALHDAVLPGWLWLLRAGDEKDLLINAPDGGPHKFMANIWNVVGPNEGGDHFPNWSDNPARAWLLAILRALIAQAEKEET